MSSTTSGCPDRAHDGRLHDAAPRERQRLEPAEEDHRLPARRLRGDREAGQAAEHGRQHHARLETREPGAEAEVDAPREGHVAVDGPADVERVRGGELARVAVRRREEGDDHVAAPDRLPVPGDVLRRDLHGGRNGPVVAEQLLDRAVQQRGIVADERGLRRVAEQVEEAVADQVRRRLVAREEEEDAVCDHLVVRQALALVLRAEEEAHEVVLWPALVLAEERAEVVREPRDARARLGEVVALVGRPAEVRRQAVGPRLDAVEVLGRRAHQARDDHRRERERELADEVHRAPRGDAVEERVDGRLDAVAARRELLRRERGLQEPAQAVVVGRVAEHEPVPEDVRDRAHGDRRLA
jgi:hypothetical protein